MPPDSGHIPTAYELYLDKAEWPEQIREEMEKKFFASIRLKNGTYKFTYPHRFDDLNELTKKFLPPVRPLKILDVAISSGVSTLEWTHSLAQAGVDHRMTAGDATVNCCLLSVGRGLRALTDSTGYPLQFDIYGKAVPNPSGKRNWIARTLPLMILRTAVAWRRREIQGTGSGLNESQRRLGTELRPIKLVVPRLPESSNLEIVEDDILTNRSFQASFHVVRAANILNRSYFSESTLIRMLRNLRNRLLTGGLLVVCRTTEQNENQATLFTLDEDNKFGALARLGKGSEIEDLILALPAGE